MWAGGDKFGFRLVHYAVMGNHIHLLVEASGKVALSRGMQGLNIRVAKALNRLMGAHGSVLADHYNAKILRTPAQTKAARFYLLRNANKHYGEAGPDPYSSRAPLHPPFTWLLRGVDARPT
jgi:REP element-mobilizing transposase RayT